jgi:hypothetical protein
MKKVIRLTENDLIRVINKVIQEQQAVSGLLDKLEDVPSVEVGWLNKFLKMRKFEFGKFAREFNAKHVTNPRPIVDTLKSMGCKNFKTCLDELKEYEFNLEKSTRKLGQEMDDEVRDRLDFLYKVFDYFANFKPNQPPLK